MIIDMEDKQVLNFNLGPCNLIYNRFHSVDEIGYVALIA